jgi:hypothetical protein
VIIHPIPVPPRPPGKSLAIKLAQQGNVVQVGPMKPTLKVPGTKRKNLKYDEHLSSVALEFKSRRYRPA